MGSEVGTVSTGSKLKKLVHKYWIALAIFLVCCVLAIIDGHWFLVLAGGVFGVSLAFHIKYQDKWFIRN